MVERRALIIDSAGHTRELPTGDTLYGSGGGGGPIDYTKRVDDVSIDILYVGAAAPGSLESASVWQIYKADFTGTSVVKTYASGTADFDKIWDNRTGYTYS